eukprot:UN00669
MAELLSIHDYVRSSSYHRIETRSALATTILFLFCIFHFSGAVITAAYGDAAGASGCVRIALDYYIEVPDANMTSSVENVLFKSNTLSQTDTYRVSTHKFLQNTPTTLQTLPLRICVYVCCNIFIDLDTHPGAQQIFYISTNALHTTTPTTTSITLDLFVCDPQFTHNHAMVRSNNILPFTHYSIAYLLYYSVFYNYFHMLAAVFTLKFLNVHGTTPFVTKPDTVFAPIPIPIELKI